MDNSEKAVRQIQEGLAELNPDTFHVGQSRYLAQLSEA